MITPQFNLDLSAEVFIDNFAGGGGASTGIERALNQHVFAALNHCKDALAMHRINHPQTHHHPEDIMSADPLKITRGRPVGGIWFSPDCKHFSKAKGGKPKSKKIRGLAWSVINWVNKVSPRVIFLENVEEFTTWCPLDENGNPKAWRKSWFFHCFVGALRRRGYVVEYDELRACDYGTPTIRKRFFLIARRDGRPIVWPEPTHRPVGKVKGGKVRVKKLKPYRTMAECINFKHPCPSIFLDRVAGRAVNCNRPLADSTMARVAKGVDRYVLRAKRPFIIEFTHQGNDGVDSIDKPIKTLTGANRGEKGLIAPVIAHAQHKGAIRSVESPIHTISASPKDQNQVLVPYLVPRYGERPGQEPRTRSVEQPGPVVVPTANGGSLVTPILVGCGGRAGQSRPRSADEPGATSTAKADTCLVTPILVHTAHGEACKTGKKRRGRGARPVTEPGATATASNDVAVAALHLTKFNTGSVGSAIDEPGPTVTANSFINRPGGAAPIGMVAASVVKMRGDNVGHPVDEPGHTVSAGGTHHGVVEASLKEMKIVDYRIPSFEEWREIIKVPEATKEQYDEVYSKWGPRQEQAIATFIAQHNGGMVGHPADKPASTLTGKCSQQQVVGATLITYYGNEEEANGVLDPSRTVTTRDRFALAQPSGMSMPLTPEQEASARTVAAFLREHGVEFEGEFATLEVDGISYVIVDIGMRMLKPRELFRAQGFPEHYIIDRGLYEDEKTGAYYEETLTGTKQVRMCGNSVCPPLAEALVAANLPEMRREEKAA